MLNQNLLLAGDDAYIIQRSLRFRASASAYLNRTPTVAGNQQKWTWSGWVKRGALGITGNFICAGTADAARTGIAFSGSDTIFVYHGTAGPIYYGTQTTPVFRDASAWYHLVVSVDTTQATAANRVQIYINSVLQSSSAYSAGYISQNTNTYLNATNGHAIASNAPYAVGAYIDGYLTEVNFIDGQALTPSSFGSTNSQTGVWQPKKYAGTYGTNGFYLPFTDVATTSGSNAGLGKDFSGNGNYWNTNNISVTAGATYDSMKDVPTLTSATQGNYCVLNTLDKGGLTISDGNLKFVNPSANFQSIRSSIGITTGKWYWEVSCQSGQNITIGIGNKSAGVGTTTYGVGTDTNGYGWYNENAGTTSTYLGKTYNGLATASGSGLSANDIGGIAFDADAGTLTFYKNNVAQGTAHTGIPSDTWFPMMSSYNSTSVVNFGQRPFAYTPPTGFKSLNTYNLPTPTIGSTASTLASKNFDVTTYTGNGSTQSIVNSGGFQPDFVWMKARSNAYNNLLHDSVRGVTKLLISNSTNAEETITDGITSFNSNGFSLGNNGSYNQNSATYVGWQWKANGSAVTNTAGSITSQVSANASAGFSVVTYTGTGSAATVGHGLGVAPKCIIVKQRGGASNWNMYHASLGNTGCMTLNTTGAFDVNSGKWNNTTPTSTVFTLGIDGTVNNNGSTYVAYCFSEVAGYSKFGSYTGNGSANGPFVATGFKPKFIMVKCTNDISHWTIVDRASNPYNVAVNSLYADTSASENATIMDVDFLSNGFKLRGVLANECNVSGYTYVYMAFAEVPQKFALGT